MKPGYIRYCLAFPVAHCLCLGTIEDLQKLRDAVPHAGVHVRFGALNVIVKVVPEELDTRNSFFGCLGGEVAGEQDFRITDYRQQRWNQRGSFTHQRSHIPHPLNSLAQEDV